jgi:hypothetical protein
VAGGAAGACRFEEGESTAFPLLTDAAGGEARVKRKNLGAGGRTKRAREKLEAVEPDEGDYDGPVFPGLVRFFRLTGGSPEATRAGSQPATRSPFPAARRARSRTRHPVCASPWGRPRATRPRRSPG